MIKIFDRGLLLADVEMFGDRMVVMSYDDGGTAQLIEDVRRIQRFGKAVEKAKREGKTWEAPEEEWEPVF